LRILKGHDTIGLKRDNMNVLAKILGVLGGIMPLIIGLFVIVISILTLLAINNLHRIPQIQSSIENIEKYLRILVEYEKKKQPTANKDENVISKKEAGEQSN
jgi:sorbitol-specific phosphotransferase system component IIC